MGTLKMGTAAHFLPLCPPALSRKPALCPPLSFPTRPLSLLRPKPNPFPLLTPLTPSFRPNHKQLLPTTPHSLPNPQTPNSKTLPNPFSLFPLPSFDSSQITPLTICNWSLSLSLALAAAKKTIGTLLNPFFWMYFSSTWIFWPWILVVSLAIYGFYCFRKLSLGSATVFEQLAIVTSTITWLTLVPAAHFNGFLEGWPIALFFIYHYFFFFESTVRKRLYGDLDPRAYDPKWDITFPRPFQLGFAAFVLIGHWLGLLPLRAQSYTCFPAGGEILGFGYWP